MGKRREKKNIQVDKRYSILNLHNYSWFPWKYPSHWWANIKYWVRTLRYGRQRIRYGFSEQDLWDLDSYLSELIASALHNFTNNLHSAPYQYYHQDTDDVDGWVAKVQEVAAKWDDLACARVNPYDHPKGYQEKTKKEAFDALSEIYFDLWD